MIDFVMRRGLFIGGLVCLALATRGHAVTVSLKAVKVNGVNVTPSNVINAAPGDVIVAELFWSGWAEDRPDEDPQLRTFQAGIDARNSYFRDGTMMVFPSGWDMPPIVFCESVEECETQQPETPDCLTNLGFCTLSCMEDADCIDALGSEFPDCLTFAYCAGVDHAPNAFSFMCQPGDGCGAPQGEPPPRPDFCHAEFSPIGGVSVVNLDYKFGSTTLEGSGPTDIGQSCYGGTLSLVVQPEACGSVEIALMEETTSTLVQLIVGGVTTTHSPVVENLTINVTKKCPAFVPSLVDTEPENCLVDRRYPHPPGSNQPAFWFHPNFEFTLHFDDVPEENNGLFQLSDFAVTHTGAGGTPPTLLPDSFIQNGASVTFRLNRPAVGTRWTCVEYQPCSGSISDCMACWSRFPGDVDGDGVVNAADLTMLIDIVQGGGGPSEGGMALLESCDMDRSGSCAAPDIIGWIDLFNGADAFIAWGLQSAQIPCPSP